MQPVAEFFKEENDFLYRKGEVKGREEERLKFVTNLLTQSDLPDEQIASLAGAPLSFIKSVKDKLKK